MTMRAWTYDGTAPVQDGPIEERNDLLKALPAEEYARLLFHLEIISLDVKQILFTRNEQLQYVYFPVSAVLALLALDERNRAVEVATIGKEGMAGLAAIHGADVTPHRCFVQVAGDSYRIPVESFRDELSQLPFLRTLLHRYSVSMFNDAAQSVACNRFHAMEARCASSLLATHDRVSGSEFLLAQEFLAYMLATRRPAVSEACSRLKRAGLITYTRARIRVLDRVGLEAAACACYRISRQSHAMVLGPYVTSAF